MVKTIGRWSTRKSADKEKEEAINEIRQMESTVEAGQSTIGDKKIPPIPPQRPNPTPPQRLAQHPMLGMPVQTAPQQQPMLGMPIQTAPPQQSTTMQVVLTPASTVAHTRSSPQQPINQGAVGQPIFPQVDFAQLLQTLLNQLAISSQLSTQQIAPSAN
jgi:hypothetical protein